MTSRVVLVVLALAVLTAAARAEELVPEPSGYRTEDYRAPVPDTLAGGRVLSTADAETIWRAKSGVFVDVLPRPPKPPNLPAATVWRDKPRFNIPGSIWLPDTGYGELAATTEEYLRQGLLRASGGNRASSDRRLLSGRLLDVVERGQARAVLWLQQRRLVSRWHGWLGARQSANSRGATGAEAGRARHKVGWRRNYSISCWMVRPSANSRWSIVIGTSQTNFTTRWRSSKIRVSQTSVLPSSSILAWSRGVAP